MGKIFKALQKSKKEKRTIRAHTSRANGVERSDRERENVKQKKQLPEAEKTTDPIAKKTLPEEPSLDLGSIHGLLASESVKEVTESHGRKKADFKEKKKSQQKMSNQELYSIHKLIDETPDEALSTKDTSGSIIGADASTSAAEADRIDGKDNDTRVDPEIDEPETVYELIETIDPEDTIVTRRKIENAEEQESTEKIIPVAIKEGQVVEKKEKPIKKRSLGKKDKVINKIVSLEKNKTIEPMVREKLQAPAKQNRDKEQQSETRLKKIKYDHVDHSMVTLLKPRSFESEQFKLMRTQLMFPISGQMPRSILVTSAVPGEGKSFVSTNLAISLSLNLDRRVLLIDCDIRKPDIHRRFGFKSRKGLSDYLNKGTPLPSLLVKTNLTNLTILPGGRPPHNPSELLSSEKMPALLKEVTSRYKDRTVIIDSPPPRLTSETSVLARLVDGIILVIKSGSTKRDLVKELVEMLDKNKILGVIMNYHDIRASRYYGYGYGKYGRYYGKYYNK